MPDRKLAQRIRSIHSSRFSAPIVATYAPGRVEVLGNHVDYNDGVVLSAAIDRGICCCLSPSGSPGVRVYAADLDRETTFDPADPSPLPSDLRWANYVKGVFHYLAEKGVRTAGVDCTFSGTIPQGAGLSSSAALEVAVAFAVLAFAGVELDPKQIARLCQRAEQRFAGCNCGLLDQFSSIFGMEHGLIRSDFRSLDVEPVALPEDALFLTINPRVEHALAESPYNARRESCERAARELDALLDRSVVALRDVSWDEFVALRDRLSPEPARRAAHVVGEIDRVERGVALLAEGRLEAFGRLLFESHESSRVHFENSCPELDVVVEAARTAGALGARLSGGGWGGSAVALVQANDAESVRDRIVATCRSRNLEVAAFPIVPSAGATLLGQ